MPKSNYFFILNLIVIFTLSIGFKSTTLADKNISDTKNPVLEKLIKANTGSNQFKKHYDSYLIVKDLKPEEIKEVISQASNPKSPDKYLDFKKLLYSFWAEGSPITAIDHALVVEKGSGKEAIIFAIMRDWARKDLKAAREYVEKTPLGDISHFCIREIALVWLEENVDESIKWVKAHTKGTELSATMVEMIGPIAKIDFKKAYEYLPLAGTGTFRQEAIRRLVIELSQSDLKNTLEWVKALPVGATKEYALSICLRSWVKEDATKAGNFVLNIPEGSFKNNSIRSFAYEWGHINSPKKVMEWANQNISNSDLTTMVHSDMFIVWSNTAPSEAAKYIVSLEQKEGVWQHIQQVFENFYRNSGEEALAFAETIEDVDIRRQALTATIKAMANIEPRRAMEYYDKHLKADQTFYDLYIEIVKIWAPANPWQVLDHMAKNHDEPLFQGGFTFVLNEWFDYEPQYLLTLIEQIKEDKYFDIAMYRYIRRAFKSGSDYNYLFVLAQKIHDQEKRYDIMLHIIDNWPQLNKKQKTEKISNAEIPQQQKNKLIHNMLR